MVWVYHQSPTTSGLACYQRSGTARRVRLSRKAKMDGKVVRIVLFKYSMFKLTYFFGGGLYSWGEFGCITVPVICDKEVGLIFVEVDLKIFFHRNAGSLATCN